MCTGVLVFVIGSLSLNWSGTPTTQDYKEKEKEEKERKEKEKKEKKEKEEKERESVEHQTLYIKTAVTAAS